MGAWSLFSTAFLTWIFIARKKNGKSRKEKLESSSLCSNAQKTFPPYICSPRNNIPILVTPMCKTDVMKETTTKKNP
jgi:hypothetical protein